MDILTTASGLLCAGTVTLDAFGVFDGHGGKQAATFASKHMTVTMLEELQAHMKTGSSLEQNGIGIPAKHSSDSMNKGTPFTV